MYHKLLAYLLTYLHLAETKLTETDRQTDQQHPYRTLRNIYATIKTRGF